MSARGPRWEAARASVLRRSGRRCERCGRPGRLEVHHRRPVARGGRRYDPENLEVLCRGCHIGHHRGDRADPARREWMEFLGV